MREIASALLLIIGFLLQSTLFSQFTIGGIVPNILIIIVASIGFLVSRRSGMLTGFFAGLLVDIFFGSVLGIYSLFYMYIGYLNGFFKKILYSGDFKLPIMLIAISNLVYGHCCYFVFFLIKGDFNYSYYLVSIILPEVIYTTVLACIFYPFINFIFKKIAKREERFEDTIG